MSYMYFSKDEAGQKARKEYQKEYEILFQQEYNKLWWDPDDPQYFGYPKEMIEAHNEEVRRKTDEVIKNKLCR